MPKVLNESQLGSYDCDGIVFPVPALSAREASRYLAACNDLEERLGGKPRPVELVQMHLHFAWAYERVTHPAVLDAVEDVLGPDLIVWATSLFPKHARDPSYISWHQDGTYWGLDSTRVTTAWIALTDSVPENGCMRVSAGTHRQEILPHTETFAQQNLLSRGQEIAVDVKEADATDVVLTASQMSLHHVNLIHGSNPNRSDNKRVGFAVRYVTPEVSQQGERPKVVLARGGDGHNHFELTGPPPDLGIDEAVAVMKESSRRLLDSVMKTKR